MPSTTPEGTSSTSLLINDWNDLQLLNYCTACDISFDSLHHKDNYLTYLRTIETTRLSSSNIDAETSQLGLATGPN